MTTTAVVEGNGMVGLAPGSGLAGGPGWLVASLWVARRTVRKFVRTPQLIVTGTIQGALFLLIFRYVFGGAINTGHLRYVDFVVPGFVATSVLFAGTGAAAGMAEDVEAGFLDRLRSLPIPRLSVITGRALAETVLLAWSLAITTGIGFAVGFRVHGHELAALGAFGLCVLYGFAFCWLFIAIGLAAKNAQAAQGFSMIVFPLTFVSSAYVPVDTMPSWMRGFANHQPLTYMTNSVRALCEGHSATVLIGHGTGGQILGSLLWCAVLVFVFAPVSIALYRRG
jgi:ABC-2 type transport system permease protein